MKKKKEFKTNHKKSEEKNEFECFRSESLAFQMGYPNHALTPNNFHGLFAIVPTPHVTQGHFVFVGAMTPFLKPLSHLVLAPHIA